MIHEYAYIKKWFSKEKNLEIKGRKYYSSIFNKCYTTKISKYGKIDYLLSERRQV